MVGLGHNSKKPKQDGTVDSFGLQPHPVTGAIGGSINGDSFWEA